MNPKYATELAAAAASQGNFAGSPNGDGQQIQNLQNRANLTFRAGATNSALAGFGAEASNTADIQEGQRLAAQAAAEKAFKIKQIEEEKANALLDPKNYIRQVSEDGGWNFYSPDGKPISVAEYSRATGKQISQALEGSNSQQDNEFSTEFEQLKEYGKAMAGDDDARTKFKEKNADWLNKPGVKDMTYAEVVDQFRNYYKNYMQPMQDISNPTAIQSSPNATLSPSGFLGFGNRSGIEYK